MSSTGWIGLTSSRALFTFYASTTDYVVFSGSGGARLGLGGTPDDVLHTFGGHVILGPQHTDAGDTCQLQFRELAANGTNCVGFKAADSIASDVIWTLPSADGSASYVLSTNGAGVLSWAAGAAPSAHNILSTSHGDAAAGTVVRGDLIYGNSTPAWARKAIGAANTFLISDGTDPAWTKHIGGAICYRSTTQTIAASTTTALSWDTEISDTDGLWDAGSPTRFTIQTAGVYIAGGGVNIQGNTTAPRLVLIVYYYDASASASRAMASQGMRAEADVGYPTTLAVTSGHMVLDVNDYVEIKCYNSGADAETADAATATNYGLNFGWIDRVG